MRKTKIICTIGPATDTPEAIALLITAGMNVARLNFSHGTYDYHEANIKALKAARKKADVPLAILLDTKGPEIRTKAFSTPSVILQDGANFTLTSRDVVGDETTVAVTYAGLAGELHVGSSLLLDDGRITLRVVSRTDTDVRCTVVHGGVLSANKSVNIPGARLTLPYLSQKDREDLLFGIKHDVDFVAASFVRRGDDILTLRKFLNENGGQDIKIIAKIENIEGIENFEEILALSDGIMIARGDMGVEVEYYRLPGIQKQFIRRCRACGKLVITATQMLESMVHEASPTRAEITDVANAVFDGTSAVMLSGETAMGKHPITALTTMDEIVRQAETDRFLLNMSRDPDYETDISDTTNAMCDAACTTARDLNARAIIALTKYGQAASGMAKFRPKEPIIAITPEDKTFHQLALSWGVYPIHCRYQKDSNELFAYAVRKAKKAGMVETGDRVVLVAGVPLNTPGNTNVLKLEVVGE